MTEQIGALALAGDQEGVRTWQAIARRIADLADLNDKPTSRHRPIRLHAIDSALTYWSTDRRKIAREETGLPFTALAPFAFDYEPAHALDQMPREIYPGVPLLARVIGVESAENWLGGYRKRHFQMGEQNIVSDSGHGRIENKLGT
ncbi:hypothetical protein [Sphingobium sp. D43FB]|uniref:hypothetical protein n=1 Tax=Sphingobium sp. D43FB TaxID=2017595 RepID=UPI00159654CD|nr:hypothetical protein [Sphingobium sp. D43FB]